MLDIVQSISFKCLAKIFGGFLALDGRLFFRKSILSFLRFYMLMLVATRNLFQ